MKHLFFLLALGLSKILVHSPDILRTQLEEKYSGGEISGSLGNFGNPPYGSTLIGRVFYPEDNKEHLGCDPLTPIQFSEDPNHSKSPILLLERGECSFVIKVRHAEDIGAKLVLIINYEESDVNSVIMTDNGLGGNLNIPAILISYEDGKSLRSFLLNSQYKSKVSLSVSFDMRTTKDKITYSFYMSPTNLLSRHFLFDFSKTGGLLTKKQAEFTPHYMLWYCPECEKDNYQTDHPDCISGGRYCAFDPDAEGELTGRDVMYEDLRQICLFRHLVNNENYKTWFQYHSEYYMKCEMNLFSKDCSTDVLKKIGVQLKAIENCVESSFDGPNHAIDDNKILKVEHDHLVESFMQFYPSIVINDQIFRGDLEASAVFEALCAGFSWGSKPSQCRADEDASENDETSSNKGKIIIIIAVIICIVLIIAILIVYRTVVKRDLNRDMKVQVNNAVAQYFQLADLPRT